MAYCGRVARERCPPLFPTHLLLHWMREMALRLWVGELILPLNQCSVQAAVPKSLLGNTAELILLARVQENQPWVLQRRSGSAPLLPAASIELIRAMLESSHWWWLWRKAGRFINPYTTQAHNHFYDLAHPNIHLIHELLENVKVMDQQIQSWRISMTQGNKAKPGYSRVVAS